MKNLLTEENTGIIIIDIQEKLMPAMNRGKFTINSISNLIKLAELYNMPVILTEHYPKGLGKTLPEIRELLKVYDPIEKTHFNCCAVDEFNERLESYKLKNIILTGVESHICVYQTCFSLMQKGYNVQLPRDSVDSRTDENMNVGFELMREQGALVTSSEAIIYQILRKAATPEFKKMLKAVK